MPKKISPEQAAKELAGRKTQPFRLETYLFAQQLALVSDPARFKTAVTTRRAGKTVSCAADLLYTALSVPGIACMYITLTRSNGKRLVWNEMKKIDRLFGLGFVFNESELVAKAPNGSLVYCSGASDRTEIDKFRGLALKKVYIDEGQSFPSYIKDLVDEVLAPALLDHAGTLVLIGTPGPIPDGYFHECAHNPGWSHHFWSFMQNPHLKDKEKTFKEELKRRGLTEDSPAIRREWFGEWLVDSDSLVYHYDPHKQDYKDLPKLDYYIMGVDLGFEDADAIAILGWSDNDPATYLVEEWVARKQTITDLMVQIEELNKKYACAKIVVDQGGLGKKIAEEIIKRWGINVIAAEKHRKNEFIELFNDALRTAKFKAKLNSRFAQDCMKVEWDTGKMTPDKKVISKRFHSDICEAALYAWRECFSFTHQPPINKPKPGTPEHVKAFENDLVSNYEARVMKQPDTNTGWDLDKDGIPSWNRWDDNDR